MHNYKFVFSALFITGLLLGTTSCEDFVYKYPRDSMASEQALADIEGVEATIYGMYNRLQYPLYNLRDMNLAGCIMSDNMDVAQTNTGRFVNHTVNREGYGYDIWNRLYNDINRSNSVLYYIREVEASQQRINWAKGQAYALRAYNYFDLLKIYARPYLHQNPYVEGQPLGVIYKTEPFLGVDEKTFQARGTINEGYNLVLEDLTMAEELLENDGYPLFFTKVAVKALLARLHLFMGNWQEAIDYATDVIDEAPNGLAEAENYIDVFANAPGAESILELAYSETDRPAQAQSVSGLAYYDPVGGGPYFGDIILRQDLINLLEDYRNMDDVRPEMTFNETKAGQNVVYQKKFASYRGVHWWDNTKLIRMAEMYLISAEGFAELEEFDNARDMLNELRAHRGSGDVIVDDNKEDFINLILNERRVEFFSEMSHRWFDLRRRGMDISKGVEGIDQGSPLVFEDYRVVERIPTSEISSNENMIQNPGY